MARSKSTPRKRAPVSRKRNRVSRRKTSVKRKFTPSKDTTLKPRKKMVREGGSAAHHAVRMKPFSNATSQPKIPDGALTSSLSRRLQNVVQIQNENGPLGSDIMHMIFAPTLGVPLTIINTVDGTTKRGTTNTRPQFIGFPGQNVFLSQNSGAWPPAPAASFSIQNESGFSKWRVVSQGLRMELDAVDDENNGWFEACRINWRNDNVDLCLTGLDGTTSDTNGLGVAPNPEQNNLFTIPMVEQNGYKTGLLKDIHKYEFMLHPQKTDHDPVDITLFRSIVEGTDVNRDTANNILRFRNTAAATQLKNETVDMNMDWIYIRFHPRDATAAGGGSKLIVNAIQNLEFAFDPSSDFAAFQTTNKLDPKHAKVADTINNNSDAYGNRRK